MRAQRMVFATLLCGYAAIYLCRLNVDAALPAFRFAFGWDEERLGVLSSLGILAYAVGKLILGPLGDRVGGRAIFLFALLASALASFAIGAATSFVPLVALVAANRFVQAGAWGGLVAVVERWWPPEKHGTVMGGLSTSFDVGAVIALVLSGVVLANFGWRGLFVVNPAILLCVAIVSSFALRARPSPAPAPEPGGGYRDVRANERPSLRALLRELLSEPAFRYALSLSFLLTFVRVAFLTWTPMFLAVKSGLVPTAKVAGVAAIKSAVFPAAGVVASLTMGILSDRFGPGRRAHVMWRSLVFLVIALLLLLRAEGVAVPILVFCCGLFLLGPYSLLAGAIALDVSKGRAAASAAGIIDAIGYFAGVVAALVVGIVAKRSGWSAAFLAIAAVAAAAAAIAFVWARRTRSS